MRFCIVRENPNLVMYVCVRVCMCPCNDGVRGDNKDKSDSFIGKGMAYSVV